MKELLEKFYAGTATPEEEAQLLRSADSLPAGPDRDLLQALAAMQRQAAISRLIDEEEKKAPLTTHHSPLITHKWPYWIGSLAMAACILLLVLPRHAAPVEMAEAKHPAAVVAKPLPSNPSETMRISNISIVSNFSEEGSNPVVIEEEELPLIPDTPEPDLFYAEVLPEPADSQFSIFNSQLEDELIIISSPSLIAREYSTTLIADATPATSNSPLTSHHSPLSVSFFGQTLGDPEADPFAKHSLFAN